MNVGATGVFDRGFGMIFQRAIPPSLMEPGHRWAAETVRLSEPVGSYESTTDVKGNLKYAWMSDMIMHNNASFRSVLLPMLGRKSPNPQSSEC